MTPFPFTLVFFYALQTRASAPQRHENKQTLNHLGHMLTSANGPAATKTNTGTTETSRDISIPAGSYSICSDAVTMEIQSYAGYLA